MMVNKIKMRKKGTVRKREKKRDKTKKINS